MQATNEKESQLQNVCIPETTQRNIPTNVFYSKCKVYNEFTSSVSANFPLFVSVEKEHSLIDKNSISCTSFQIRAFQIQVPRIKKFLYATILTKFLLWKDDYDL